MRCCTRSIIREVKIWLTSVTYDNILNKKKRCRNFLWPLRFRMSARLSYWYRWLNFQNWSKMVHSWKRYQIELASPMDRVKCSKPTSRSSASARVRYALHLVETGKRFGDHVVDVWCGRHVHLERVARHLGHTTRMTRSRDLEIPIYECICGTESLTQARTLSRGFEG